jgi:cardiolipin synthase A/B
MPALDDLVLAWELSFTDMLFRTLVAAIILAAGPGIAQTTALPLITEPGDGLDPIYNLGSENFSEPSLTKNRELGILLTDSGILSSVQQTMQADFSEAKTY